MTRRLKAVYRDGTFVPVVRPELPEGSEVELVVHGPFVIPPEVTDPEERAKILQKVIEGMNSNPIPVDAPRFTREQLHERR